METQINNPIQEQIEISDNELEQTPVGWMYIKSGKTIRVPDFLLEISHHLMMVHMGKIKRLMIWAPPGSFKSQTISVGFPAFTLERKPDTYILSVTNIASLALEFGRGARDLVSQHGRYVIRTDSSAAGRWQLEGHKGGMFCVGVGSKITGRRGGMLIIDDPIGDWREVDSPTMRENLFTWYRAVALDRLEPGAPIIIAMQRWHKWDLCGMILEHAKSTGEQWTVLRLPAVAEEDDPLGRAPGDVLDPQRYTKQDYDIMKANLGYWWFAKFQQRPMDEQEQSINPEWFPLRESDKQVDIIQAVRYFDMATKKQGRENRGDFAAGVLTVKDIESRYGIMDIRRFRKTAAGVEKEMADTIVQDYEFFKVWKLSRITDEDKANEEKLGRDWYKEFEKRYPLWFTTNYVFWFESDTGGTGEIAASYITRQMRERTGLNIVIKYEHPSGSKAVRAQPMLAQAMAGNYWISGVQSQEGFFAPVGCWDIVGFKGRIAMFGQDGAYDDEADGASGGFSKLWTQIQRVSQGANYNYGVGWI